jgi:hypothetical protein
MDGFILINAYSKADSSMAGVGFRCISMLNNSLKCFQESALSWVAEANPHQIYFRSVFVQVLTLCL